MGRKQQWIGSKYLVFQYVFSCCGKTTRFHEIDTRRVFFLVKIGVILFPISDAGRQVHGVFAYTRKCTCATSSFRSVRLV